jgi:hypothetical protein
LNNNVSYSNVPKGCPRIWPFGVSNLGQNDALIQVDAVVGNVTSEAIRNGGLDPFFRLDLQKKPNPAGSKQNLGILPLPKVLFEILQLIFQGSLLPRRLVFCYIYVVSAPGSLPSGFPTCSQ